MGLDLMVAIGLVQKREKGPGCHARLKAGRFGDIQAP